jgi:hypothetical protein
MKRRQRYEGDWGEWKSEKKVEHGDFAQKSP